MKKEAKKADQKTVATESKKHFKWEELPFVNRKSLWDPEKQISAKSRISRGLIGEEFALAYLKLMKEEWPRVGLVSLFFIARDMSRDAHLNGYGGIERNFFDMIDSILIKYCLNLLSINDLKEWNRARLVSLLACEDIPKTHKLEALKTMGQLDELLWNKKASRATA